MYIIFPTHSIASRPEVPINVEMGVEVATKTGVKWQQWGHA